jgi:hypothetical protein
MTIRNLRILIAALSFQSLLIQTGCQWLDEQIVEDPQFGNESGMWLVGGLYTGGDARSVKGFKIGAVQYAFLADGNKGLNIISITAPENPASVYSFQTNGFTREVFADSIGSNKYVFLADEQKGLFILNATVPSSAFLDTHIAYGGGINSICMKDGYLYVALRQGNIKILNLNSFPDSVIEVGTYTPLNNVEHIEISETNMYLLEGTNGFEIIDISDPSAPLNLSTFNTPGSCNDLKVGEEIAYVADGITGVTAVNISNPAQPLLLSITDTESDLLGIDYSPNFMFTADNNEGAEVFNLFNPEYPEAFGYYETPGTCYSVNYFRGKVLIANGQNGLLILRF